MEEARASRYCPKQQKFRVLLPQPTPKKKGEQTHDSSTG
jgi:hypothetical protein